MEVFIFSYPKEYPFIVETEPSSQDVLVGIFQEAVPAISWTILSLAES